MFMKVKTISSNQNDISNLYNSFICEKNELESTLATIEILSDKNAVSEIQEGLNEIQDGKTKKMSFDEIENL